jgi:hypothetical protein
MIPEVENSILEAILTASFRKKPIPLNEAVRRWGGGSSWEDLIDSGRISREDTVRVTNLGLEWYTRRNQTSCMVPDRDTLWKKFRELSGRLAEDRKKFHDYLAQFSGERVTPQFLVLIVTTGLRSKPSCVNLSRYVDAMVDDSLNGWIVAQYGRCILENVARLQKERAGNIG